MHCQLCGYYFTNCTCYKRKKEKLLHTITTALLEFHIIERILAGQTIYLQANQTNPVKAKAYINRRGTHVHLEAKLKPSKSHKDLKELYLLDTKGRKLYWRKLVPVVSNDDKRKIELTWSCGFGSDNTSGYVTKDDKQWDLR